MDTKLCRQFGWGLIVFCLSTILLASTVSANTINWAMDEGSNNFMQGESNLGPNYDQNATLQGGAASWETNCMDGGCYAFNGEIALIPTSYIHPANWTAFTVGMWVNKTTQHGYFMQEDYFYFIALGHSFGCQLRNTTDETLANDSAYVIDDGVFHHLACSFNGTCLNIYVNGVLNGQTCGVAPPIANTGSTCFGGNCAGGGTEAKVLDAVFIADYAMTDGEIYSIYDANDGAPTTTSAATTTSSSELSSTSSEESSSSSSYASSTSSSAASTTSSSAYSSSSEESSSSVIYASTSSSELSSTSSEESSSSSQESSSSSSIPSTTTSTTPQCGGSAYTDSCYGLNETDCPHYYEPNEGPDFYNCVWETDTCVPDYFCYLPCGTLVENCSALGETECSENYETYGGVVNVICAWEGGEYGCVESGTCRKPCSGTVIEDCNTLEESVCGNYMEFNTYTGEYEQCVWAGGDWGCENTFSCVYSGTTTPPLEDLVDVLTGLPAVANALVTVVIAFVQVILAIIIISVLISLFEKFGNGLRLR